MRGEARLLVEDMHLKMKKMTLTWLHKKRWFFRRIACVLSYSSDAQTNTICLSPQHKRLQYMVLCRYTPWWYICLPSSKVANYDADGKV